MLRFVRQYFNFISCLAFASLPTWLSPIVSAQYYPPSGSFVEPGIVPTAFDAKFSDYSNQGMLDSATPLRHKPVVGLELGVISLAREAPESQVLVVDSGSNVLLNADQLQGSMGAGLDAKLDFFNFFSDSKAVDVQLRFFQAGVMESNTRVTSSANTTIFFGAVPATPVTDNDLIYESNVRSFEANLVGRTPYRLRFLAGYRFFELDERFDNINAVNSTSTLTQGGFSRAENRMNGLQVGSEATLLTNGHSRIFGSFKYGIFSNDVLGSTRAANSSGASIQADTFDSVTSELLDFQLGGSISLSRSWSFYAGYQGLVLSDVVQALEQSRNGDIVGTSSNPAYLQDTQFHGFKITGMATW